MAQAPLSRETLQQAINSLAEHSGNQSAAARALGVNRATFQHRLEEARRQRMDAETRAAKPRIRVPVRAVYSPTPNTFGKAVRVFVFGCAHDSPLIPDKSRFWNAGKLAAELNPDYIVDLGDSLDLDSFSTHAAPGSVDDRAKPGFLTEVDSLDEAYAAFHGFAPDPDLTPRFHLNGNHENRANRFEAMNPTSEDVYTLPIRQTFARYGWSTHEYREWLFLEGVGFIHAPINGMGKEVGGINANQTVARESTFSVVWSHTHKNEMIQRPKFGVGNAIQTYNTGSFMPQGYLKSYAGLSMTGWTYGCSELTLRDGQIEAARYWSELELQERYA
jgi:hypothetical protein